MRYQCNLSFPGINAIWFVLSNISLVRAFPFISYPLIEREKLWFDQQIKKITQLELKTKWNWAGGKKKEKRIYVTRTVIHKELHLSALREKKTSKLLAAGSDKCIWLVCLLHPERHCISAFFTQLSQHPEQPLFIQCTLSSTTMQLIISANNHLSFCILRGKRRESKSTYSLKPNCCFLHKSVLTRQALLLCPNTN